MAKKKLGRPRTAEAEVDVGARIRLRRTKLQMSQRELSRRIGVSLQQILKYESGSDGIAANRLPQLAKALDVPVTFFFGSGENGQTAVSTLFLDTANKVRLARAFSRIPNRRIHRELVRLVEGLAQRVPPKRHRHKTG